MKVLFISDVTNVARAGEIKDVPAGYARNYLIRKKLAVVADSAATTVHAQAQIKVAREAAAKTGELTALAQELEGKEITIKARSGKEKLFGSITSGDIADNLLKSFGLTVDKKKIELTEPIHRLGIYEVMIKLSGDLQPKIKVNVIEEIETIAQ